jgi:hypothetical protein
MKSRWHQPKWMRPLVHLLNNTGGHITPEMAMNCDAKSCNLVVNAPRALLCQSVRSQVILLESLHKEGLSESPSTD